MATRAKKLAPKGATRLRRKTPTGRWKVVVQACNEAIITGFQDLEDLLDAQGKLAYRITDTGVEIDIPLSYIYSYTGRGPGKIPYDMVDIIENWIVKNNIKITDSQSLQDAAGAIARSIENRGTKLRRPLNVFEFIQLAAQSAMALFEGKLNEFLQESVKGY